MPAIRLLHYGILLLEGNLAIEIAVESRGSVHIVSLNGRLDSAGVSSLQTALAGVIQNPVKHILMDCRELKYVSSVGLGVFTATAKSMRSSGGKLHFAGLSPHVRSVFEMVGFLNIFAVYSSVEEALEHPDLKGSAA